MSYTDTDPTNTPLEDVLVTLTDLPVLKPSPTLPVLAQGGAAALSDLTEARAQLVPVLNHNKLAHSKIDGQLLLLEGTNPTNIRCLDSSTPPPERIKAYLDDANERLMLIEEALLYQKRVLSTLDTRIQQQTPYTCSSNDIDSYTNSIYNKSKNESFFTKVPSTVDRFGTSGSRNAREFLRTFYTQIQAFSSSHDHNNGNTIGRLLGQVIEDTNLKNEFARDFVASMDAKHPAKLTTDELSTIFLKHCGKTSDNIETSKRLLSMAPKTKESYRDYGKRASREMQHSGSSDHCPAITSYLEGTVPMAACSMQRLWYFMDHIYTSTGTPMPKVPIESFNKWYNSTLYMEGNVDDYGVVPHRNHGPHNEASVMAPDNNKRNWSDNTTDTDFKRVRMDTTPDTTPDTTSYTAPTSTTTTSFAVNTTHTNKDQNCGQCGWDNHSTAQCRAPHCAPCRTYHFAKHCPKRNGMDST
jgi:hypothetical protein